jgi:hypothetical protein
MFTTASLPIYAFNFLEVPLLHFMTRDQSSVQQQPGSSHCYFGWQGYASKNGRHSNIKTDTKYRRVEHVAVCYVRAKGKYAYIKMEQTYTGVQKFLPTHSAM